MWMMGYNDGCGDFSVMQDPFNGSRKLRPLVPRPSNSTGATTPPCCSRIHASSEFLAQYHQLGLGEQQRAMRDFNAVMPQVVVSSRWNPTPEQLRALEELYRRGTRTPSAEQIQQITAQLRRYGKIEGKNVFYWFQNHKARERQKRRRQMESNDVVDLQFMPSSDHQKKELTGPGGNRTVYEVEETKNWAPSSSNCMTHNLHHHQQESVKAIGAESRTDGWLPFDEQEFQQQQQQRRNSNSLIVEKNATWQMMQLSSCPSLLPDFTHLINSPTCCTTASSTTTRTTDQKQQQQQLIINHKNDVTTNNKTTSPTGPPPPPPPPPHDLSIFIAPSRAAILNHHPHRQHRKDEDDQSPTLELFPLRSNVCGDKGPLATEKSAQGPNFSTGPSYQFFEFLPLKN